MTFRNTALPMTFVCLPLWLAGCSTPSVTTATVAPSAQASAAPSSPVAPASPMPAPSVAALPVSNRPANEAGLVPILEYHRITKKPTRYDRTAADFREDLERLRREHYRPVALQDLLAGKMNLPKGASPVVLTFDDADATQFRYLPMSDIDPDCAVGILQAFAKKYPDFPVVATFYVLPESAFGVAKDRAAKFKHLRDIGCEIGNHTVTHRSLKSLTDAQVQAELGGAVQKINAILPDTSVTSVALPMGISPKSAALLARGTFAGRPYMNASVLLVGANPSPSPYSENFDPMRLPRIQAVEGESGITDWLNKLGKSSVYVSDGDDTTVSVPANNAAIIASARLRGRRVVTVP
ncbi:MAG: polysaccharide deacetylase family protein [Armatimonadetes bacterium]|nr:polysaccharide deacetylase family protein [Armatimonadota bacterium]